jgi:K+-sensing histidine kinase KdpD
MVKDKKQYTMHNGLIEIAMRKEQEQREQQKFPASLPSNASVEQERDNALAILQETKQQLMRVNKMKSDALSMLSHEFRTALATIHDFSEMICDQRASITDMRELAADIRADACRLTHAIHDILERERMESEHIHLALESEKLTQVIIYLLSNIIKYALYEGDICVKSYTEGHIVHVCVQHHGSSGSLNVKDPHSEQNTPTEAAPMSTLPGIQPGLRTVRQIVQLHGGQLWSENNAAEGPTFHFTVRFGNIG